MWYTLELAGPAVSAWVYIAVSVKSYSQVLVSIITWNSVQTTAVQLTTFSFHSYDPNLSQITLEGRSVEMVDARWYETSLSAVEMLAESGAGICPSECYGVCTGPVSNYFVFVSRNSPVSFNLWSNDITYIGQETTFAITGWYSFKFESNKGFSLNIRKNTSIRMKLVVSTSTQMASKVEYKVDSLYNSAIVKLTLSVRYKLGKRFRAVDIYCGFGEWQ